MKDQKSKTLKKTKKPSLKDTKKASKKKVVDSIDLEEELKKAVNYMNIGDKQFSKKGRDLLIKITKIKPRFISTDGDNPYYYLGVYYYRVMLKQQKKAIEYYTKAIKLNPKDAQSIQDRGFCWMELGERARALKDLKKAKLFEDEAGLHPDLDEYISELSEK
jgi:tetratricopeptide (TPR) repeat protein